jgi:hypothetical protein
MRNIYGVTQVLMLVNVVISHRFEVYRTQSGWILIKFDI